MKTETNDQAQSSSDGIGLPSLGKPFPVLKVHTTWGGMTIPDDFKGKWMVLFSHPADFTPVCTTEFYSFAKHQKQFDQLGAKLIGLSIDQVFSHLKWIEWIENKFKIKINYPVIADDQGRVAQRLGMIHPGKGTHTVRAVFIVDPVGILRWMIYYPQEIGRNMTEILRSLEALQIATAQKVALPANWPKNELIGDDVIIPPARDYQTARRRLGGKGCFDWWFCHKKFQNNPGKRK